MSGSWSVTGHRAPGVYPRTKKKQSRTLRRDCIEGMVRSRCLRLVLATRVPQLQPGDNTPVRRRIDPLALPHRSIYSHLSAPIWQPLRNIFAAVTA